MSNKSSIAYIVSQMKTQVSTTLGWDVVVNYNEEEINNLLKVAYEEDQSGKKSIAQIECSLAGTDQFGDDYTVEYNFELGPPVISFTATRTSPVCNLTIPITGGTASTDKAAQTVGTGVYTLIVKALELASATGEETTNYTSSDKPFVFPPSVAGDGVVVIDFATSSDLFVDLIISGPDKCPNDSTDPACKGRCTLVDSQKGNLQDQLKNIFRTKFDGVRLELARVNSIRPPSSAVQLVPKSFMMAAYTPTGSGSSILSLFIRTGNSDNGRKTDLNTAWSNTWNVDFECPPIPANKTASVILGKQMVFESMIKPALDSQKLPSELTNTTGNLRLLVQTDKKIDEPAWVEESDRGPTGIYEITHYHGEIDVTLPKLELALEQDNSNKAVCRGAWEFEYGFSWSTVVAGIPNQVTQRGKVTVTNTLNKVFSGVNLLDSYTIKTNFSVTKGDWDVEATADSQTFWDRFNGGVEEVPSWVKDMNIDMPTIQINLGSLDFFLTTNLLLPNREVIDVDVVEGVKVPGDFYIVGNVKRK